MPYVYSTATCDMIFPVYASNTEQGKAHKMNHQILIRGGANLAKGKAEFITKYGVRTEVSEQDLALLQKDKLFKQIEADGYFHVDERKVNPEAVAADMSARDDSAPLVPQDYDENSPVKPVVKEGESEGNAKPFTAPTEHEEEEDED